MNRTKIEWTDYTWNPVTGCTKVSPGCEHCYADRTAKRMRGRFGYPVDDPFRVTLHADRLKEPLHLRAPSRVLVCSMGDLFHEDVSFAFVLQVFTTMKRAYWHTFQVLTKRPAQMQKTLADRIFARWVSWPLPNVWLGVSAENQECFDERVPALLECPAAVRYASLEPLLEPVENAMPCLLYLPGGTTTPYVPWVKLDWVIVGGETGPGARPMDPAWPRGIRDQCKMADVPFFMKQMSGGEPIPDDLMIREYPKGKVNDGVAYNQ